MMLGICLCVTRMEFSINDSSARHIGYIFEVRMNIALAFRSRIFSFYRLNNAAGRWRYRSANLRFLIYVTSVKPLQRDKDVVTPS